MPESFYSYLAGLWDLSGCFAIAIDHRKYRHSIAYIASLCLQTRDREFIEWLQHTFGGHISTRKGHPDWYIWVLPEKRLATLLPSVLPYMQRQVRKKEAELILALHGTKQSTRKPPSPELAALREQIYQELRRLHNL